jgi:hypothetical protein
MYSIAPSLRQRKPADQCVIGVTASFFSCGRRYGHAAAICSSLQGCSRRGGVPGKPCTGMRAGSDPHFQQRASHERTPRGAGHAQRSLHRSVSFLLRRGYGGTRWKAGANGMGNGRWGGYSRENQQPITIRALPGLAGCSLLMNAP